LSFTFREGGDRECGPDCHPEVFKLSPSEEQKKFENERWDKLMELLKDKPDKLIEVIKTTI